MQFLEKEIHQCTQLVCSTLLGFEVHPSPGQYDAPPANTVTGSVQIAGEWKGAVILSIPSSFVEKLTEILFSLESEKISTEHKEDAVGEFTNMVGGNIKALLPEPSTLSAPIIAMEGQDLHFPSTKLVTHCKFEYQGEFFGVSLFEQV